MYIRRLPRVTYTMGRARANELLHALGMRRLQLRNGMGNGSFGSY